AAHTFAVALEDEEIAPPVLRTFKVEPGKWVTLEVDLRDAAKARGLDAKRMATLTVGVVEVAGPTKSKGATALMDNVRLARANVALLSNLGCRGGSLAALRLFDHQLTFAGDRWTIREAPTLVDCDLRHCNSNQSVVRTADNRLWAAYGLAGRLGATAVNVRYSD